jgi:hypothetical protein
MRCPAEISVDHSHCPKSMSCLADPCAVMPGHAETAIVIRCGNRVELGEKFCKKHMKEYGIVKKEDR